MNRAPDRARDGRKVMRGPEGLSLAMMDVADSYDAENTCETQVVLHGK